MAATLAITGILVNGSSFAAGAGSQVPDTTQKEIIVDGTITLSGNYGAASGHGDPLDFTAPAYEFSIGGQAPTRVEVFERPVAGVAPTGYSYVYCPGPNLAAPTQAGGKLAIMGTGAASGQGGTELTNASAYSSFTPSLNGIVLGFRAWFARL